MLIILTGEGRNGKSLLVEWIQFLLGAYGMEGKITTLTEKPKSGAETELACSEAPPAWACPSGRSCRPPIA